MLHWNTCYNMTSLGASFVISMLILKTIIISSNGGPLKEMVIARHTKNHKRLLKKECMQWRWQKYFNKNWVNVESNFS